MEGMDFKNLNAIDSVRQKAQNVADSNALNDLRKTAKQDPKEALRPVAEQFEALFLQQIMKEARKVSFDDGWLDGNQGDFFKDWHDSQLAQTLSTKGSLGLADSIVEQLAPKIDNVYTPEQFNAMQEQKKLATVSAPNTGNNEQSVLNHPIASTETALKFRQQ
jgi:flagellar protein FlgJ